MNILVKILKYVLTIVLSIILLAIILMNILFSTIFSEKYVINKIEESNYYNNIYEEVKKNFENYVEPSGLEGDIMEGICSEEQVKKDSQIILGNLYEGTQKEIDTQDLRNKLDQNIRNNLSNKKITDSLENAIQSYEDQICKEYTNTISHTEYEQEIYNFFKEAKEKRATLKITLYVAGIVTMALILLLNIKKLHRAISLAGIAGLSSGFFGLIANSIINKKVNIANIKVLNDSVSTVLQYILKGILESFATNCKEILVLGIILILLGAILEIHKENQ